jgi:CheY-like chemotaxis protein
MPVMEPSTKTVLVVDDEKNVRFFLKTVLEKAGLRVETAADGMEALEKVRTHPPDVISLDLVMPKKSGAKFLLEIRKDPALQNVPVVLVTAHAKDALGKEDFDAIMSGDPVQRPKTYLMKPVKAETYLANIKRALEMKHMKTLVSVGVTESSSKKLKDEIKELLDDADPEKLRDALKILKEKRQEED